VAVLAFSVWGQIIANGIANYVNGARGRHITTFVSQTHEKYHLGLLFYTPRTI